MQFLFLIVIIPQSLLPVKARFRRISGAPPHHRLPSTSKGIGSGSPSMTRWGFAFASS